MYLKIIEENFHKFSVRKCIQLFIVEMPQQEESNSTHNQCFYTEISKIIPFLNRLLSF